MDTTTPTPRVYEMWPELPPRNCLVKTPKEPAPEAGTSPG